MRLLPAVLLLAAIAAPVSNAQPATGKQRCAALSKLSLPHASIELVERVDTPRARAALPYSNKLSGFYHPLPDFCRVVIRDHPSPDSDIRIEVWLPDADWNRKYRGQGNGGFAGSIHYAALAAAVREGYATAGTDTGHMDTQRKGLQAEFALHHPEKVKDFGWRAIHDMTVDAKAAIAAFYGAAQQKSFFASCSDGGREALMEAQRFPDDYDGILAGAPANDWTRLQTTAMWAATEMLRAPGSYIPAEKVPFIAEAVLAACDSLDGVRDGILNDPRQCHFDPASMLCKSGDSPRCLLPAQVETLNMLYAGPHDAKGRQIFPGFLPGSEDGPGGWAPWITGRAPRESIAYVLADGFLRYLVYEDPDWEATSFDISKAMPLANKKLERVLNSTDPDLRPFAARGGKLILYHGWNDPAVPARSTVNYWNNLVRTLGRKQTDAFVRLYMVSGMQHCTGGPGATFFGQEPTSIRGNAADDIFTALEQWVDHDRAPGPLAARKLGADHKAVLMTRSLCPFPQTAKYLRGDTHSAASFTCVANPDPPQQVDLNTTKVADHNPNDSFRRQPDVISWVIPQTR